MDKFRIDNRKFKKKNKKIILENCNEILKIIEFINLVTRRS